MKLKAVQKVWNNGGFIEGNSKTVAPVKKAENQAKKQDDKKKYTPKSGKSERTFRK